MHGSGLTQPTGLPSPSGDVWARLHRATRTADQRRKAAILAGSALLHALVLGWLAFSTIGADLSLGGKAGPK